MADREALRKKLKEIRTQEDAAFLNRSISANNKRVGQDNSVPAPASASEAERYIDLVTGTNQHQREQVMQNQKRRQTETTRAANRFYQQEKQKTAGQAQEASTSDYVSQVLGISQDKLKQAVTDDFARSDKTFDAYNRDFQNYLGGREPFSAPSSGGSLADQFASLRQQYKDRYHLDYTQWDGSSPTKNGLVSAASYPDMESMQAAMQEQKAQTDALKQMAQRVSSLSQPDETDTFPLSVQNLLNSTTATKLFKALYPQEYADFISGNTTKDTEPYIVRLISKAFGAEPEQNDSYKELLYQMMQGEQYASVEKNADFAEKSRYRSTVDPNGGYVNYWSGKWIEGKSDTLYEYINGDDEFRGRIDARDIKSNATIAGVDHVYLTFMNARQVGIYNYLYATKGKEEAEKYIDYIAPSLKAMYMQERQKNAAAAAAENPFGASVASVVLSPMKGLSMVGQMVDYAKDGGVDPNEGYNWSTQLPATYRAEVSQIAEDKWGKKGSFLYQTGMSIADNLFQLAITGGSSESAVLAIMGTGAAADGVLAAKNRGLSDDQAMALGVIAGAAEVVTEKVSLDALLGKISFGKSAVARLLTNVIAEGSEEGASDIINLVADVLVSKEQSEWNKGIEAYKMQGYSERDAFWAVFADQAAETGLSILGGAISGGVLGAGSIALRAVTGASSAEQAAAEMGEEAYRSVGQYDLIRRGLAIGKNAQNGRQTTAFRLAAQYNKSGKTLDNYELGELYAAVLDAEATAEPAVRYGSDPVDLAMEQIRESGTISNRTADIIAKEQDTETKAAAMRVLQEQTGVEITGDTASEQRAAVKDALMKLYQQERSADTEEADAVEVVESNQVESLPTEIDAEQATNPAEAKMLNAPDAANTQEQAQETAQAASAVDTSTIENRHLRNIMDSVLRRGSVSEAAVSAVMKYKDAAQALESMTGKQIEGKGRKAQVASVRSMLTDAVNLLRNDETYSVADSGQVANDADAAYNEATKNNKTEVAQNEVRSRAEWYAGLDRYGRDRRSEEEWRESDDQRRVHRRSYAESQKRGGAGEDSRNRVRIGRSTYDTIPAIDDELKQIEQYAAEDGVNVFFLTEPIKIGHGMSASGAHAKGNVFINVLNGFSASEIYMHETTHNRFETIFGERDAAKREAAVDLTLNTIYKRVGDDSFADILGKYIDEYKSAYESEEKASVPNSLLFEEMICDLVAGMNRYGDVQTYVDEARRVLDQVLAMDLNAAMEKADGGMQAANADAGEASYSINEQFGQELQEWFEDGQPSGEQFVLGSTGQVLQGLGAIENDIYMNGDKISAILEQHPEMSIREIQRIPEMLEDPILVLKSKGTGKRGNNSRMVLYGSIKAKNGQPVLAILDLRPMENGFMLDDMQKVNSAYTKNNPVRFVTESDVLYADKKRTIPLLRQFGLTLTSRQLLRNGSIGSISHDGDSVKISGVPFSSVVDLNSIKFPVTNDNPTNNTEARYSTDSTETSRETDREKVRKILSESIKVYGVIPEGENPVRAADIPAKMTKNSYVSEAARTVYEAGATPDGRIFTIDQILTDGKLQYVPEPLERYKNEAVGIITQKGWQVAVSDFHAAVLAGQSNARTVALGAVLLNNAGNSGMSGEAYIQVLQDYVQICHDTGAALAANRILKTLTPEARLYGIQNAVNELNDRFETAKRVAEGENIEIDPDLLDRFLHAEDDAMRDEILDEIYQNIADQIPPNLTDMFDALRYLNMLGNFKTMGRNVLGNISMWGIKAIKNKVKTGLERMVKLANPDYQKTTSAVFSPAMRKAAMADFENVRDIAMGEPKYSTVRKGVMKEIDDRRTVFKWEVKGHNVLWGFEKARNAVDYGLNNRWFGDEGFIRFNYANELAGYLTANGVSAQNLKDGNVDADLLNAARNYAIKEAQKATFHDDNQVSKLVSGIGTKHADSKIGRLFNRVVTGVMPFRKTPANVLVRAIEYSPAGFVMAVHDAVQMRKGAEVTGSDLIDHIASAVTGSALMAIGFVLARAGIAVGSGDDDEEQAAFDKLIGHQTYAIEVGGKSFTIDWLTPTSMPFFVGVEAFRTWEERGDLEPDDVIQALLSIGNPLLEMSMMSGVSNLLDDLSYSDNRLVTLTLDALFGYYEQGIGSTLVGQINRSMYKNRKTTMVQDETWAEHLLPDGLQYELASLESRTLVGTIDYLLRKKTYAQIDYVDAWGSMDEYNTAWQVAQQFLLPGYGATLSTDEVNDALQKLYDEMQAEGIEGTPFPERPQKTISWTTEDSETGASVSHEVELTGAQYVLLATAAGQMKHQIVSELLSNETWSKMTTEQKLDAITTAYGYATDTAKQLVSDYVPQSGVNTDIADAEAAGVSASTFISFKELEDELKPDTDADGNDIDGSQRLKQLAFLNSMNIPDSEKLCLYIYDIASNARVEKVQTLMQDANLSWRQVSDVLTEFDTLTGQDLRPVDRATAFAKWSDEHFEDKQSDVVKQVMRFTQVMYVDAATYEKYAAAGLAPQDAANVQDALTNLTPEEGKENVTKRQRTDAILKLGMSDEDTANAISALEGEEDGPMRRVIDSGVKNDTVVKVARALNDLKPDADHEQVTIGQKFLAVANLGISESEKMKAITAIDSGTNAASLKIGIADDYGVLVSDYVNFMYKNRYRYDADGNGNFTQAEATAAVNSMSGYGTAAKAALWQLICTGAKGKSNPFSVDVGNAVRRAMGKEE